MRRLPAATPVVGRCSISRVIAQCTVSQCIVTTDGPGEPLTPRSAFTSPGTGAWSEPKSCEIGLCVPNVRLLGASLWLGLWTTSYRSKTVERGLIAPTCSLSASHATTERRQKSRLAGARPPRGVKSLRLGGGDARACPNFFACKLKQGGLPDAAALAVKSHKNIFARVLACSLEALLDDMIWATTDPFFASADVPKNAIDLERCRWPIA